MSGLGRPENKGGHPRWSFPPSLTLSVEKTLLPWGPRGCLRAGSLEWNPLAIEWPLEFRKPTVLHRRLMEGYRGLE